MDSPRNVDVDLVEAQETRRILDRLYGYTLSPVLWSRVTKNLSAGRVQSPAVKLIVDREIARRNFRGAAYWDLRAELQSGTQKFTADLKQIDGVRVATGSDFDDTTGELKAAKGQKVVLLDQKLAEEIAVSGRNAKPYTVTRLETTEGFERPAAPFMTTTLQQDANRKFGFSADRTMRIAQGLYEGIDLGGEQVGLITYMRTDSLTLSGEALGRIRDLISREYPDCLPDKPQNYTNKVRNAQEAHEAIRPTDVNRRPDKMARYLNDDQLKLYNLIWQRSVASQMKPARVLRTEADISAKADSKQLTFLATGKQITFEGFLKVYLEGKDDDNDPNERKLPTLSEGLVVNLMALEALGHQTKPPARYTDATLIKKLEEQGIGRPSTYASIISVIVDRGYVRKQGKQLIPTFKAFLTMEVLENNFQELMDLGFTAKMDESLDDIAEGKENSKAYLTSFFLGTEDKPGLKGLVESRKKDIPYPAFIVGASPETEEQIVVRTGKDGSPFIQIGDGDAKRYANVPEDLAPADLTVEKAMELLSQKKVEAESIGIDPSTGRRLLLRNRQGYYLEVERTPEEIESKEKPTWISLPPNVDPHSLAQADLDFLCAMPKTIGNHPDSAAPIQFKIGKYGPYVECGSDRRTVEDWRSAQTMTVEQAVEILSQPRFGAKRAAPTPFKEFGVLEGAAGPVKVLAGRFGPYITDGETNVTLPKAISPDTVTAEQATELLAAKRAAGPSVKRPVRKGKATAAKKSTAAKKTTTVKKTTTKTKRS